MHTFALRSGGLLAALLLTFSLGLVPAPAFAGGDHGRHSDGDRNCRDRDERGSRDCDRDDHRSRDRDARCRTRRECDREDRGTCSTGCVPGDLIAAQDTKVGTVSIEIDGDVLTVTYEVDDGWCLSETHLYVGTDQPEKTAPGTFKDSLTGEIHENLGCATRDTYEVDISGVDADELVIAAHAVVHEDGVEGGLGVRSVAELCAALPSSFSFHLDRPDPRVSYFTVEIQDDTGFLDGLTLPAWCIDVQNDISPGDFDAEIYCLCDDCLDTLPEDVLLPENLPLVTYLLNRYPEGADDGIGGVVTMADLQRAIWYLVAGVPADDQTRDGQPGNAARLAAMLADVELNGPGFVPGCGDLVPFAIRPFWAWNLDRAFQTLIALVPLDCPKGEETAWMCGDTSFCKAWGWTWTIELPGNDEDDGYDGSDCRDGGDAYSQRDGEASCRSGRRRSSRHARHSDCR